MRALPSVAIRCVAVALAAAPAAPRAAATFPVAVGPGGRHLVDAAGKPFRIHGDTAWSMVANLTAGEAAAYLDDRQARGFNAVLVNLLEHRFATQAPANRAGVLPFSARVGGGAYAGASDLADLASPAEAYFAFADGVVDAAAARGILVLLTPIYVGFGAPTTPGAANEGWSADMHANGAASCLSYGRFLGDRYRNRHNVLWVNVADANPGVGSNVETCAKNVMSGLRQGLGAGTSDGLHTAHLNRTQVSTDNTSISATGAWDVNASYTKPTSAGGTPWTQNRAAYGRSPAIPVYVHEDYYENEHGVTRAALRYTAWGSFLTTIGGFVFGTCPTWHFGAAAAASFCSSTGAPFDTWQSSLAATGSQDMQRMGAFLDGIAWHTLAPSTAAVPAGAGTEAASDFIPAAAAADGSLAVAYVPSTAARPRTFTVDLRLLCGAGRARWLDPTTGTFTADATELANTGTHAFTTPGNNAAGAGDWVLVLDPAAGTCSGPPPTPTPTPISSSTGSRCGCSGGVSAGWGLLAAAAAWARLRRGPRAAGPLE